MLVVIIAVSIFFAIVTANMAKNRGRDAALAAGLGFFFGIFAVIGYAIAGKTMEQKVKEASMFEEMLSSMRAKKN